MITLIEYIVAYLSVSDSPQDANSIARWISSQGGYDWVDASIIQSEIEEFWNKGGNSITAYENSDYPNLFFLVKDAVQEFPD